MRPTPRHTDHIMRLLQGAVETDAPLSRLTSFRIGGPADVIAKPADLDGFKALVGYVSQEGLDFFILGGGTNVLFPDEGIRGVVVRTIGLRKWRLAPNGNRAVVKADAGIPLSVILGKSALLGFGGAEALWGVPGSFGGAISGNAGVPGAGVADYLRIVTFLTREGEIKAEEARNLEFGYRRLVEPAAAAIISGELMLERRPAESILAAFRDVSRRRKRTQPRRAACAGCVFKNPAPDKPAGALIDRLGLKGLRVGDACVSEVHANFIINRGNASAADVNGLIRLLRDRVKEEEGIELETEIRIVQKDGRLVSPMVS